MSLQAQIQAAADAVLEELRGRKGVGDELEQIEDQDPDIYAELVEACRRAAVTGFNDPVAAGTQEEQAE